MAKPAAIPLPAPGENGSPFRALPQTRKVADLRPHPKNAEIYGDGPDEAFIASVAELGVLAPLHVTQHNQILGGHTRWVAARQAGLEEVVVLVRPVKDDLEAVRLMVELNRQRQKTNEVIGKEARALLRVEKEEAARRQRDLAGTRPGKGPDLPECVPEGITGDARDKVGKALGMSGKTVERAAAVVSRIDELREAGDEEGAEEIRAVLNGQGVAPAHRLAFPPDAAPTEEETSEEEDVAGAEDDSAPELDSPSASASPDEGDEEDEEAEEDADKDEDEAAPPTDEAGVPWPPPALEAFNLLSDLRALCRKLDEAHREAERLGKSAIGLHMHWQSVQANLRNARTGVWQARPAHVCPYCRGERPGCQACQGKGWVTTLTFKAAPKE